MADTSAKIYAITPHNATQEVLLQKIVDLEDQRNALLDQQLRLKSLWNTTVIIHRFPTELLSHIFCAVKDSLFCEEILSSEERLSTTWVHVRLVCRYWREVADASPALWCAVDFEDRCTIDCHWLSLCLSRSAAMPFDVMFHPDFPTQDAQLKLLLPHSSRIRTLRLPFIQKDSCAVLAHLLDNEMPALETLRYVGTGCLADDMYTTYDDLHISVGHYPRLRFLELSNTTVPRDPLLYSQLRSLALTKCSGGDLTYKAFLDMLSNARTIKTLRFFGFLNHLSPDVRDDHRRISLPHLTSLTLGTHAPEHSAKLLTHVALPAIVSLDVQADVDDGDFEDDLPETLPQLLPRHPAQHLSFWKQICEVILVVREEEYRLSARTVPSSDSQPAKRTVDLAIYPNSPFHHNFVDGIQDVVKLFRGTNLVKLTMRATDIRVSFHIWRGVFRAFPLLEHFDLKGSGDVVEAWRGLWCASIAPADAIAETDGPQPHSEGGQAVACPRLHTIDIDGYFSASGELFEEIIRCLRDRADMGGTRLTKLVIGLNHGARGAQSYEESKHAHIPTLKSLVAEVEYHSTF